MNENFNKSKETLDRIIKYMESLENDKKVYTPCYKCGLHIHQIGAKYCCHCGMKIN